MVSPKSLQNKKSSGEKTNAATFFLHIYNNFPVSSRVEGGGNLLDTVRALHSSQLCGGGGAKIRALDHLKETTKPNMALHNHQVYLSMDKHNILPLTKSFPHAWREHFKLQKCLLGYNMYCTHL
jgi:hypothetical protein